MCSVTWHLQSVNLSLKCGHDLLTTVSWWPGKMWDALHGRQVLLLRSFVHQWRVHADPEWINVECVHQGLWVIFKSIYINSNILTNAHFLSFSLDLWNHWTFSNNWDSLGWPSRKQLEQVRLQDLHWLIRQSDYLFFNVCLWLHKRQLRELQLLCVGRHQVLPGNTQPWDDNSGSRTYSCNADEIKWVQN